MWVSIGLHGWPDGGLLDTANTDGTFNSSDLNVTLISPVGSPGVSDDVEILGSIITVSDGGDGVIELGSAGSRVDDSGSVTLEDTSGGADGDGGWSTSNSSLKLGGRFWGDSVNFINESSGVSLDLLWASSSLSVSSSVWKLLGQMLTVGSNVLHGFGLPSTTASSAVSVTGDNLLLGEIVKNSFMLDSQLRFNRGGGRESPA